MASLLLRIFAGMVAFLATLGEVAYIIAVVGDTIVFTQSGKFDAIVGSIIVWVFGMTFALVGIVVAEIRDDQAEVQELSKRLRILL
jgi:hypothetical protein